LDYLRRPENQGHLKVMEILRDWDPIGVISEQNQDEYDGYSAGFVQMLDAGASLEELTKHMQWIVKDQMGLGFFDQAKSRRCAEAMIAFWQKWRAEKG